MIETIVLAILAFAVLFFAFKWRDHERRINHLEQRLNVSPSQREFS